jgi:hypothetical protein
VAEQQGPSGAEQPYVRPSEAFFRKVLWFLVAYSEVVWMIALVDWLRHPLTLSPYAAFEGHPAFRAFALFVGAPLITFLAVLILRRQPQNIVGLLIMAWGVGFSSWALSAQVEPVPFLLVSLPISAWWMSLIFLPFYFPDGHAYPRWLSPALPAFMVFALVGGAIGILGQANIGTAGSPSNPLYVPGVQGINQVLAIVFIALMLPMLVGVFVSPLLRYRRADFIQRQQIKWFAWWSMLVFTPYIALYLSAGAFFPESAEAPAWFRIVLSAFIGIIGQFPPIIIALAILRYRLYDIDIIIRKTLVYAVLSGLLALVYFGSVILLQTLFGPAMEDSPLLIVLSTLLIAALFSTLRRRVQQFIDRRFYRSKYDAARTLAQFAQHARDEVELEALTGEVARVVQETLQPEQVSVWLRQPADILGAREVKL